MPNGISKLRIEYSLTLCMEIQEPAAAYARQHYTIEEYLELEDASEEKHEYYQGEIFAMAGTKLQHNIVSDNILATLMAKLNGKPCRPFGSDMRIHVEKNTLFTYPDVSVICGEPQSRNNDEMNMLNPTVICEVASPATQDYDRKGKFGLYQQIPTLKEYITIEPEKTRVDAFFINDAGNWELRALYSIDDVLHLNSIGTSLLLREIYMGTRAGDSVQENKRQTQ